MQSISIPLARYRFCFKLNTAFRQPDYAGSMLRGNFGHMLKRLLCISKQADCRQCMMYQSCQYPAIFEPPAKTFPGLSQKQSVTGYLIEAPQWGSKVYQPGEKLCFDMVLTGQALSQLSLIILCWQKVFARGIGKYRVTGDLMAVSLMTAEGKQQVVFSPEQQQILVHNNTYVFQSKPDQHCDQIQLHFQTPLRLQKNSRVVGADKLTARDLLITLMRRLWFVNQYHNQICLFDNMADYLDQIDQIQLEQNKEEPLFWRKWQRYSNRQQQMMDLSGLVGNLTLKGDLDALLPFIQLGEYLHVGKNTVFGLGKYAIAGS